MATLTVTQFTRHLKQQAAAVKRYIEKDAPRLAGIEAVNHFKKSFIDEGFTDMNLTKWKPAKRLNPASLSDEEWAQRIKKLEWLRKEGAKGN